MNEDGWSEGRRLIDEYLDRIDREISVRLQRIATPMETTLTDEFLACLDPAARDRECPGSPHESLCVALAASLKKADFVAPSNFKPWNAEITTISHSSKYEGYVSHADIGLVIQYPASVGNPSRQPSTYLLQAKKLYPAKAQGGAPIFHGRSRFAALGTVQRNAMRDLEGKLGKGSYRYLYYMPRLPVFERSGPSARRSAADRAAREGFRVSTNLPHDGIWIGGIDTEVAASMAMDVHSRHLKGISPFRTFILDHMQRAGVFGVHDLPDPLLVDRVAASSFGSGNKLAYAVAMGEAEAWDQVVEHLDRASLKAPVLPARTMRLIVPTPPIPKPSPSTPGPRFGMPA